MAVTDAGAPAGGHGREITARGIVLGALITVVFMAANIYLGLKTGMTFSSSIPAALISMGALRLVGGAGILETNIVQTQASAAGTLCNVILVLPGLVLIGHWHGFPFWETSLVCLIGGWLGVAFSIPLRRALVTGSDLPYPEGVAAAEVLRAGHADSEGSASDEHGLTTLLTAAAGSGLVAFATSGLRILAEGVLTAFSLGGAVFSIGSGFSLALVGVGYLVGIGACLALLTGVVIAWGIMVPVLTALTPQPGLEPGAAAQAIWSGQVRLVGAGIIAVGGFWTVATLVRPIARSIRVGLAAGNPAHSAARQDRDLPLPLVGGAALALCVPLGALFAGFAADLGIAGPMLAAVVAAGLLFCLVFGAAMAAVCGYLAGLLGSSTSPISGIGILTAMVGAALLPLVLGPAGTPEARRVTVALVLLAASVIVTAASIANDNLQDLKTGQIVDATPWRQQLVLIVGVAVGSLVIVPLLSLLYGAYGFVGSMPRPGMDPALALTVPQAALVTQIADGIVARTLPWPMLLIGCGLGAVMVALEVALKRRAFSFPALTVGIGMYLPLSVEMTIGLGGLLGFLCARALRRRGAGPEDLEASRRRGVLIASGFLVGESFVGIGLTAVDAASGHSSTLSLVGPDFAQAATYLGAAVFAVGLFATARFIRGPVAVSSQRRPVGAPNFRA
ncbi:MULTISPECIES: oligopeptide transporter, OPT family [unclassified Methylobacterium]|uniref:OPT family oligopeptide transporter n=1 Tax=unclassified Methylobacterium TaxID=2615210 RepID=UPI0011C20481|nr:MULTISPECIES: oligopeptide transporter, OPT family [unclassified Methylobacterium]QEE39808.1 oligopeptide transporter, OPT family [Methylobacterium sp. WL1]TXN57348.1 oligopeptide transporter, OPT family [Methylobacterium sp. WL2]